jgi:hypothetical protein
MPLWRGQGKVYVYLPMRASLQEGPRSRSYGRAAALRLIVQPCDKDEQFCTKFSK